MPEFDAAREEPGLTVESLRNVVESVATRLRDEGYDGAASLLDAAAGRSALPADDVLAMREALVGTRLQWSRLEAAVRGEAAAALTAAKRLSISL